MHRNMMSCSDYRVIANALYDAHRDMRHGLGTETADAAFVAVLDRMIQAFQRTNPRFNSLVFEVSAWGGMVTVFRDGRVEGPLWQRCALAPSEDQ